MSAEILVGLAGVVLSVLFEYFPGLAGWYDKLEDNMQRSMMLGMLVIVAAVVFGLNCAGWFEGRIPVIVCNESGVEELIWLLIVALGANQTTHRILPK